MKPKLIDLFSGCGGMSLGFQNAGFEILAAYDNWWPAIDIYSKNFNHPIYARDLSDESVIEEIRKYHPDIIIGGPPCQDFSIAGNRNFEGNRANLTLSYGKIIDSIRPKWFVMENVYNIEKSPIFEKVINVFRNAGYGLTKRVWDASYMGVPQMRQRYFVIGKLGANDNFLMEELVAGLSHRPMTVRDYLGDKLGTEFYYMHPRSYNRRAIFSIDEPSSTIRGVNRPMPETYRAHRADKTKDFSKVKNLSTVERSWIQTFPDNFVFCGSKADIEQTIGNAVPVKMAEYVGKAIMKAMSNDDSNKDGIKNDVETTSVYDISSPIAEIRINLEKLNWTSFRNVVSDFLRAFALPETTLNKIISQIGESSCGPIYVYRKAVLFCCRDESAGLFENQCLQYDNTPLVLSFTPDGLFWRSKEGAFGFSLYENIHRHIDIFLPLITNERSRKDYYKTKDIGELVASLYRSLIADGNSAAVSVQSVFNCLYIILFPIVELEKDVRHLIDRAEADVSSQINSLFLLYKNVRFISAVEPKVSKDSFSYIKALIEKGSEDVDIELLSSLIYKLFGKEDAGMYGHPTSLANVQKVIRPLLLDAFEERLKKSVSSEEKRSIAEDILKIKCIDPTNSPGCFLSSAYLGLLDVLEEIDHDLQTEYMNKIDIGNFVSIVDNDIAAEITRMSLAFSGLSDNDVKLLDKVNDIYDRIRVVTANPLLTSWEKYVSPSKFTVIMGSPRFLGSRKLNKQEKEIVHSIFDKKVGTVDYCSAWLVKAARYIQGNSSKAAFVLTNSVVQGVQVSEIWKTIFGLGCEIAFAHSSFKWRTGDATNIGVTVVVVGIQSKTAGMKYLYDRNGKKECGIIGPYLIPDTEVIVEESDKNLFGILPLIKKGNMAYDGTSKGKGKLLIDDSEEVQYLIECDNRSSKYIKRIIGSEEFIQNRRRWCVWIPDEKLPDEVKDIPELMQRIERVREYRKTSAASESCKSTPHRFRECYTTSHGRQSLVIPAVSSEDRPYIPVGFINDQIVVSNLAFCVYDCAPWVLAIVCSRMHMLWVKTVCGALETRYRYSNTLGYNTFPVPYISEQDKSILKSLVFKLVEIREKYCELSLGTLYKEMPDELRKIHELIDNTVDSLYSDVPFGDDSERIECLISLYQSKKNG